ncbi:MAG: hypothetical protein CVV24_05130 [Ignavibacteriae bacterium HGW-Ignavibacteriae-3]|nr:MAG: hypothetical protein CVV24_05130 [Ignavibacteriae bacterium HGW-Ignavibacteriae-3]
MIRVTFQLLLPILLFFFVNIYSQSSSNNKSQKDAEKLYKSGVSKYESGHFNGAMQDLNSAIKSNPNYAEAYYYRGIIKGKLGGYRDAIKDFNKAIELNENLVKELINRRNDKDLLQYYDNFLEDSNSGSDVYARTYYSSGLVKNVFKDYEGAIADFNRVIEIYPRWGSAYVNRGLSHYYLSNKKNACVDWNQALRLGHDQASELIEKFCK